MFRFIDSDHNNWVYHILTVVSVLFLFFFFWVSLYLVKYFFFFFNKDFSIENAWKQMLQAVASGQVAEIH